MTLHPAAKMHYIPQPPSRRRIIYSFSPSDFSFLSPTTPSPPKGELDRGRGRVPDHSSQPKLTSSSSSQQLLPPLRSGRKPESHPCRFLPHSTCLDKRYGVTFEVCSNLATCPQLHCHHPGPSLQHLSPGIALGPPSGSCCSHPAPLPTFPTQQPKESC